MNRDEKLSRIAGLPPKRQFIDGHTVLSPSEPAGGTWVSANDAGVSFALVNWYAVTARVIDVSRGEVVKAMSACTSTDAAESSLAQLPLHRMNPFRLVGVFPGSEEIVEWRWDLETLTRRNHRWKAQQWISSGYDEAMAQELRSKAFRAARWQAESGTVDWLRRLHCSHSPHRGAFSMCVHRSDAGTVSYTEISVSNRAVDMNYHPAAPCEKVAGVVCSCARKVAKSVSNEVKDSSPRLLLFTI